MIADSATQPCEGSAQHLVPPETTVPTHLMQPHCPDDGWCRVGRLYVPVEPGQARHVHASIFHERGSRGCSVTQHCDVGRVMQTGDMGLLTWQLLGRNRAENMSATGSKVLATGRSRKKRGCHTTQRAESINLKTRAP